MKLKRWYSDSEVCVPTVKVRWNERTTDRLYGLLDPYWGLVALCGVSPLSIAATNFAWILSVGLAVYAACVKKTLRLQRTLLDGAWLLFVVACLLSLVVSLDPLASLKDSRDLGLIIVYYLFAWTVREKGERNTLIAVLLATTCLASFYGLFQTLTGLDFLGHFRTEVGRATGFFSLHLTFGEYLVVVSSTGLGIVLWEHRSGLTTIVRVFVLASMLMGIVLSQSKGAVLGLLVGWMVVCAVRSPRHLLAFVCGCSLLVFIASWLFLPDLYRMIGSLVDVDVTAQDGLAASNAQRLLMWWSGFRISLSSFFNGIGMHALEKIYPFVRHPLAIQANQWHLHNNFIHLGVTTGMCGLAAFIVIFLVALKNCRRGIVLAGSTFDKGLSAGLMGGLVGFLVCGLTEACWEDSEVRLLLFALLGLQASSLRGVGRWGEPGVDARLRSTSLLETAPHQLVRCAEWMLVPGCVGMLGCLLIWTSIHGPSSGGGVRLLEALLGFLVGTAFQQKWWPGRLRPLRTSLIGYAVAYAGYSIWKWAWERSIPWVTSVDHLWYIAGAVALLYTTIGVPCARILVRTHQGNLFDAALLVSMLLWGLMCICTQLLLGVAGFPDPLFDAPVAALLIICNGAALLYVVSKTFSRETIPQRIAYGLLCVGLLYRACAS